MSTLPGDPEAVDQNGQKDASSPFISLQDGNNNGSLMAQEQAGLTAAEAAERLRKYGENEIYRRQTISFFGIARHEVTEPMILLLLFIGVVYSLWGELFDALTIILVITLLVTVEVFNEYRAKNAIAALEHLTAPKVVVLRDGQVTPVDALQVVPGDILVLTGGTKIAADAHVIRSIGLQADESALTGESFPVGKPAGDPLYAGTVIVSGEGNAEVTTTGRATRLGELAAAAQAIRPPRTRLQLEMKALAGTLVYVAAAVSVAIGVIGLLRGFDLRTMVLTALSLSFATVPEELPIIITMVLGLGAYNLSKKNFLVKKLKAAETMGTTTVIVTDKTGTLTQGRMQIAALIAEDPADLLATALGALPLYSASPIDHALRERAPDQGLSADGGEILQQRDFGNGRKTRAILRRSAGSMTLFLTGAPEEVVAACTDVPRELQERLAAETSQGRRVIAVARKAVPAESENLPLADLEHDLTCRGLISFDDPPRAGVEETIRKAGAAGIRTIMVTGDHPSTAREIARQIGIWSPQDPLMTGVELDRLTEEALQEVVQTTRVFARTTPQHKYRIVQALQKNGEVVAVTGDGINDALALRGADVGIAMGIRGTDVARDAAEVVLADDNYITITTGIFEGRKFFDNLEKGIRYYLSIKLALICIFLLPVIAALPLPFAPIQIIVLELFMDLGASAGFVAEPAEADIFTRAPRGKDERVFSRRMLREIAANSLVLFIVVIAAWGSALLMGRSPGEAQTYAFSAWIFGHIALAYTSRSERVPLLREGIFSNRVINLWAAAAILTLLAGIYLPFLNRAILLVPIPLTHILIIAAGVSSAVALLELRKIRPRQAV